GLQNRPDVAHDQPDDQQQDHGLDGEGRHAVTSVPCAVAPERSSATAPSTRSWCFDMSTSRPMTRSTTPITMVPSCGVAPSIAAWRAFVIPVAAEAMIWSYSTWPRVWA